MKSRKNIIAIITILILIIIISLCLYFFVFKKEDKVNSKVSEELFTNKEVTIAGDDILSEQAKIDEEIAKYMSDKQYTFNNPKVIKNPYKISPLSALIIFQTSDKEEIKVTINNEEVTTITSSQNHAIPIYGLYAGKDNKVVLTRPNGDTKEVTITTEEYQDKDLNISISDSKLNDDLYFLSGVEGTIMKAFDKQGNIRWYLTSMYSHDVEFLANGHLLLSNGVAGTLPQSYSGMVEVDYLGKVYKYYNLSGGYHHEANELSDGSIMVASSNPQANRMGDYVVILDPNTAKVKETLDLYEVVKNIDPTFASTLEYDWAWNNSLDYNEKTKDLIMSLRGRNSVISINFETKKINWIFGDISNWSSAFAEYILTPSEGTRYPNGQHSAFLTEEGYLGIFNNDYDMEVEKTLGPELSNYKNNYSSANLYEIDGKTISSIWEYNDNKSLFSFAISNFQVLDNGNRLIDFGWEFIDQAYEENRSIREYSDITYARILEIDSNNQVLFDATIDYGQYRVFKNKLYSSKTPSLNPTRYKALDNTEASKIETIKTEKILDSLKIAENNTYQFNITRSSFSIDMFILEQDEINILFVGQDEDTYIVKYKESGTNENAHINITFTGDYAIYLQINGKYYNTGKVVRF